MKSDLLRLAGVRSRSLNRCSAITGLEDTHA